MFIFPEISPYIFQIELPLLGKIGPTWYGLMYVIGFLLGYQWLKLRIKSRADWTEQEISELLTYCIVGVILGGRIGYVLFYQWPLFVENPWYLLQITKGGMSFHGGLLGVILALALFSHNYNKGWVDLGDLVSPVFPIGLFFGRIGNFINAELWGKTTSVAWGVVFPNGGPEPRHPSQLYEACLEGLLLFIVLNLFARYKQPLGRLSGLFLVGYAIARFAVEFVRIPDAHIGYMAFGWLTRGQLLTLPMLLFGVFLIFCPQNWLGKRGEKPEVTS